MESDKKMKKTAFIFPGQGSQYQGMGKEEYENYDIVRHIFEEASDSTSIDVKKLCFDTNFIELTKTNNSQVAIFTTSYAMFKVFMEEEIEPSYLAGHSLGEITALTCSGAISFSDAIKIVKARGRMMQSIAETSDGKMTAVMGIGVDKLNELCEKYSQKESIVGISNINSLEQIIISGDVLAVDNVVNEVISLNGKCTELKVNAPFHSKVMECMVDQFRNELEKYNYHELAYPVISNVTARPYNGKNEIVKNLTKHIISPVLWKDTIDYLVENEVDMAIELGPKDVLTKLIRNTKNQIKAFSYDNSSEAGLLKVYVNECKKKPNVVTMCLTSAVCVKNNNWNDTEYKIGVIDSYKRLKRMHTIIENENREPNKNEMLEAIDILKLIFNTKKVSESERKARFTQIYKMTGFKDKSVIQN